MKARLTLAFALLLVCTGAGAARAQETVCDAETGSAYGHCNAYCEAMDCDSDNPQASATACSKVRAKYQQTTGHDLPCEVTCPCAEVEGDFADLLAGVSSASSCSRSYNGVEGIFFRVPGGIGGSDPSVFVTSPDIGTQCGYVGPGFTIPLSAEEDQACRQILEQYATSHGLTCTP